MTSSPILMYHQVVSGIPEDIHAVTSKAFATQMRWLHEHGYQGVAVEDLLVVDGSMPSSPKSRRIAITFDDGYLDFYTNALPILQQYGFKATVFLVAKRIGGANDWDPAPGLAGAPLLDWHHIREMADNEMGLGAHTCTHPDLTAIPIPQAKDEIRFSRDIIEEGLQKTVRSFAYPFSLHNDAIVKIVYDSGYDLACTYVPDYVGGCGKMRHKLQRIGILATDSLENFAGKVQRRPRLRFRKIWRDFRKLMKN